MKRKVQRSLAIFMAAILVLLSAPVSFAEGVNELPTIESDVTVLVDENFENGSYVTSIMGRGATIGVTEQTNGNHELTISGRSNDWNGLQIQADTTIGKTVSVTAKVRSANTEGILGIQYKQGDNTEYKWIQNAATLVDSYTTFSGSFDVPSDAMEVYIYIQSNGAVALEPIMVDDIKVTIPSSGGTKILEDFEGTSHLAIERGATLTIEEATGVEGSKALKVSGRTQNWNGVNFDVNQYIGTTVKFAAKVKSENPSMFLSIQYDMDGSTSYNRMATVATGSAIYVDIAGSYDIPSNATNAFVYMESEELGDFYVDNIVIEGEVKQGHPIQEDLTPLKQFLGSQETLAGKTGVAIPVSALTDSDRMRLVTKHFNSVTAENEMKPESFLGSTATLDSQGDLVLNFTNADKIMDYILQYNTTHPEDTIGVRGHVLVWHSQTPDWFFKEGYTTQGAYVTPEVMLGRLDNYIKTVIQHYDGADSKYKGIIYAWDVVNEQIETSDYNSGSNPNSLRISNGSQGISNWYQVFKGDDSYITEAFRLANQYAPEHVKLFYNDYGETDPAKCVAICNLLRKIKEYPGARISGMGMQAHYNMDSPSVEGFEQALRAYSGIVDEVQLTELDLQSSMDYNGTNQAAEYTKQAYRYKSLFDTLYALDKEEGIEVSAVTLWGTHDGASWLQSASFVGGGADGKRKQCPLLFDDNYQAKPAYYGIVDPGQLEPYINSITTLYSTKDKWSTVPVTRYTSSGTEIKFQIAWNETQMKVRVQVPDKTDTVGDKITLFVEADNNRTDTATINTYSLDRSNAVLTEQGYEGVISIPLSNKKVGDKIGFDLVVTKDGVRLPWNDLKNTQETSSKYYGVATMKPFAELNYGTPNLDGSLDNIWQKQGVLPLTVKTGTPEASANVRAMWDDTYLYVYADVTDHKLSKASVNKYEQDSLEIFLDQNNGKTASYEVDDCQYRINYDNEASFNGTKCTAENIKSVAKQTETGYSIEAAIKWTDVVPQTGQLVGIDFQINDDTGNGSRAGTYNWYDEKGVGYTNPSVFGTVSLLKGSGGNDGPGTPSNPSNPSNPTNNTPSNPEDKTKTNPDNNIIKVEESSLQKLTDKNVVISKLLKNQTFQGTSVIPAKDSVFPGIVSLSTKIRKAGERVYVYRVNEVTQRLETIKGGYSAVVDKNGKVTFYATDGSTYVVLNQKADASLITPLKDQIKLTTAKSSVKSGDSISMDVDLPDCLELTDKVTSKTTSDAVGAVTITYQVSDKKIASIDKTGMIKAKAKGEVIITATIKLYNGSTKNVRLKLKVK